MRSPHRAPRGVDGSGLFSDAGCRLVEEFARNRGFGPSLRRSYLAPFAAGRGNAIDAGIVLDVEATPAHRLDEINAAKTMINRVEQRFDLKPERLIGDTNYGTPLKAHGLRCEPFLRAWPKALRRKKFWRTFQPSLATQFAL
jgi:hypothetical protein